MKTGRGRFDAACRYIHQYIDSGLAQHIETVVREGNGSRRRIGNDLSLGSRDDDSDSPAYATRTSQRQALRALLLCQRVYFSRLWAEQETAAAGGGRAGFGKCDMYPPAAPDWPRFKAESLAAWEDRAEDEVREALRMFTVTSHRALDAAIAARQPGDARLQLPLADLVRRQSPFPGHGTCYSAVMFWLFRSGLVSYRWMMRHSRGALDTPGLKRAFGAGEVIWPGDRPFGEGDSLPAVPHGYVVHLYVDNPMQWKGHWLISAGDGTAFGRNNDDEGGRVDRVYALCNLDRQFLAYKGNVTNSGGLAIRLKGVAEIFDPSLLPERL